MKNVLKTSKLLDLIGNTPLIFLEKLSTELGVNIYGKLEYFNPGHSTKDRIALHIIEKAEREGRLKQGSTIIESTSGNTGFSIAMLCALKGYKCVLAVNSKCSEEKIETLRVMGAEVHICPANVPADHPDSYYSTGQRLGEEIPNSIYVNQYFNPNNSEAHYLSTGPEIWEQTQGKITHIFACSGTGGTISGISRFLKEKNKDVNTIGVDAVGSILKKYKETGIFDRNEIMPYRMEGVGKNIVPGATDFSVIDRFVKVNDYEAAVIARILPTLEGLFLGYSSGAAIAAVIKEISIGNLNKDSVPVVLLPDHGSRYMTKVFSDKWFNSQKWEYNLDKSIEKISEKYTKLQAVEI